MRTNLVERGVPMQRCTYGVLPPVLVVRGNLATM